MYNRFTHSYKGTPLCIGINVVKLYPESIIKLHSFLRRTRCLKSVKNGADYNIKLKDINQLDFTTSQN